MRFRTPRKAVAVLAAAGLVLAACGGDDDDDAGAAPTTAAGADTTAAAPDTTAMTPDTTAAGADTTAPAEGSDTTAAAGGGDLEALHEACIEEGGKVNLIALPDEWANYKGILDAFGEKYPDVEHPVANPNYSSQEELDAIVNLAGQDDMPDAIDVSPAKAQIAIDESLWEPYQPTTWDEIPDNLKDPDGNWIAAYYGVMAITTNTTLVPNAPKSWADLKKPEYKGTVALNGDPRTAGSAFAAVMAASLANGGSADDIMPGIEFFAELKANGNLIPTEVTQATVISGDTPIAIDWSYNLPALMDDIEGAGYEVELNFPSDGVYGGFYSQGVVKDSPHPSCSKLWIEHILSDEGAVGYLEGGAMPARYAELEGSGALEGADTSNLPPAETLAQVKFLTSAQVDAANAVLAENWGPMVADA
ncbi:MAG: ABC transporter substrate-binding protein [Actinobacteria bacterium]|nr:ABC transporter substrate-binding protein [Actinomycetota bacterium]